MAGTFTSSECGNFDLTAAATAVAIPNGYGTMVVSNPSTTVGVWFTTTGTAAIPATGTFADNYGYVAPGTVQTFGIPISGGTFSFIATGTVTINIALGYGS
jgi:hypothetical protein